MGCSLNEQVDLRRRKEGGGGGGRHVEGPGFLFLGIYKHLPARAKWMGLMASGEGPPHTCHQPVLSSECAACGARGWHE